MYTTKLCLIQYLHFKLSQLFNFYLITQTQYIRVTRGIQYLHIYKQYKTMVDITKEKTFKKIHF